MIHADRGQQFPSLASHESGGVKNTDGPVDIQFGLEAPKGREKNSIQPLPGKGRFVVPRLDGPLQPWFGALPR